MSEWFKEHDWKSCDGGDSSGGSNPLLCATQSPPQSGLFAWRREEVGEVRHSPEVARALPARMGAERSEIYIQVWNIVRFLAAKGNTNGVSFFI